MVDGGEKIVVSMSRRTDPRWHAGTFIKTLREKYPPGKVHTLVIWTKFPMFLTVSPYREALAAYDQLYVHVTITGFGGTPLEPDVPAPGDALAAIPELIKLAGDPRRLRIRPDPLLAVRKGGRLITNVPVSGEIIVKAAALGVTLFSTSFMENYLKVERRLRKGDYTVVDLAREKRVEIMSGLLKLGAKLGVTVNACCVAGFPVSACIDGGLLTGLHPGNEACRTDRAAGQRKRCGCAHSVDIGWYSMKCLSGCLYCYAS
ncbi:MAG: DUF1848 family protein [Peptococcaceae bacterium]|nr:MAG: DUF1848 family protein [Peptococcaceae bacterium]